MVPPIREILLPTDLSEHSKLAMRYANSLAERFGAQITVLHVIEPPAVPPDVFYPCTRAPDQLATAAERTIKRICEQEKLEWPQLKKCVVQPGVPYEVIVDAAKAQNTDLIVLATHGRTGLAHVVMGSTTEKVIQHAPCPILVLRV